MHADLDRIRRGGHRTTESAEYVHAAATSLGSATIDGGMFGGVATAARAGARLATVHQGHVDGLTSHHGALYGISARVATAAATFETTDVGVGESIARSDAR